jgi:hypothetical protein
MAIIFGMTNFSAKYSSILWKFERKLGLGEMGVWGLCRGVVWGLN